MAYNQVKKQPTLMDRVLPRLINLPFLYSSEDQFSPPPQSYLKRHSTGDAMELLSHLRSQPKFQEPNSSTGSLGSATGNLNKGGAAGNSATSITDF